MHSIVTTRLRPYAVTLVGLVLVLSLADLGLRLVIGSSQRWHPPYFSWHLVNRSGQQAAAVEQGQSTGVLTSAGMVVVFGASTVREGLESHLLEEADPQGRLWLIVGGSGSEMKQLEVYTLPFSGSRAHAGTIMIGIHRTMFCSDEPTRDPLVGEGLTRRMAKTALRASWLVRNSKQVTDLIKLSLFKVRSSLMRAVGMGALATYRPSEDPWALSANYHEPRARGDLLARQWRAFVRRCAPQSYSGNELQVAAFCRTVARLRLRCDRLCILLMPETSRFRDEYSLEADQSLAEALKAAGISPEDVVDMRDRIDDSLFYDYGHLNSDGRDVFCRGLPATLQKAGRPASDTNPTTGQVHGSGVLRRESI